MFQMKKITRKFLKIFLSLGLMASLSFITCAQEQNKKLFYVVNFTYKNKDLEKDRNSLLKNKTSAKELVNLYAVMQKLFEKYNISKNKTFKTFKRLNIITPDQKQIKLTGNANITADFSEENGFKKLFKNFNQDVQNVNITQKDFENAKKHFIDNIKNELNVIEKDLKECDCESKSLIEIGHIAAKKFINILKKSNKEILSKKKISKLEKNMVKANKNSINNYYKKVLNDDKKAKQEGKMFYKTIKEYKKILIPKMKSQIKQIKDTKFDDVKNLTKDLKINLNKLEKREVVDLK